MKTIRLEKKLDDIGVFYQTNDAESEFLMQHCMNEDLFSVNEDGFQKLEFIATAHGWKVEVVG